MEIQTRNMMAVFLQVLHQVPPATPTSSFWDWLNHQFCRIANYMISSLIFRVPKVGTWNEWFARCTSNTLGQRPSLAKRRKWLQWVHIYIYICYIYIQIKLQYNYIYIYIHICPIYWEHWVGVMYIYIYNYVYIYIYMCVYYVCARPIANQ